MSLNKFHIAAIATWFATLVVFLGVRLSLGFSVGVAQVLTALLVGCVPAIVLVVVFRGAPRTIGQILYETDLTSSEPKVGDVREIR